MSNQARTNAEDRNKANVSRRDFIRSSVLAGAAVTAFGMAGGCAGTRRGPRTTPFFP